jgi:hypothetical protein
VDSVLVPAAPLLVTPVPAAPVLAAPVLPGRFTPTLAALVPVTVGATPVFALDAAPVRAAFVEIDPVFVESDPLFPVESELPPTAERVLEFKRPLVLDPRLDVLNVDVFRPLLGAGVTVVPLAPTPPPVTEPLIPPTAFRPTLAWLTVPVPGELLMLWLPTPPTAEPLVPLDVVPEEVLAPEGTVTTPPDSTKVLPVSMDRPPVPTLPLMLGLTPELGLV